MSTIDPTNRYKVNGPTVSLKALVDKNPDMLITSHAKRLQEDALWQTQMAERNEALQRHSKDYPAEIYGQITVNGKLVATVWDDGAAEMPGPIAGLTHDGNQQEIAKARVMEIAQALGGEIRYSNFLPVPGGGQRLSADKVPQHILDTLPKVTVRPFALDEEMLADSLRAQAASLTRREQAAQASLLQAEKENLNQSA